MVQGLDRGSVHGHYGFNEARASHSFLPMTTFLIGYATKTPIVRGFLRHAGSSIVSVEFVKADGSLRKIQFNPCDRQEIKGTGKPSTNASIVRCRDFAVARKDRQGAWRSFDCERVVSITAKGETLVLA